MLSILLAKSFKDEQLSCTISDVMRIAEEQDYPLPLQPGRLCDLAQALSTRMSILFLKNMSKLENSWIVLDIDKLLHVINGRIFAPASFTKERCLKSSSTGILPFSQLREWFQDINVKPKLVVAFLGHLEFCKAIKDPEVLRLITSHPPDHQRAEASGISDASIETDDVVCRKVEPTRSGPKMHDVNQGYVLVEDGFRDGNERRHTSKTDLAFSYPSPNPPQIFINSSKRCSSESEVSAHLRDSKLKTTVSRGMNGHREPSESTKANTFPSRSTPCAQGRRSSELTGEFAHSSDDNTFFFFPGLISATKPKDTIWNEDTSFTSYFGWCLLPDQYFTARFLELIFLRLTVKFAITKLDGSPNISQECTIWKNGLRWLSNYGIETLVEKIDEGLVLLMRAKEGAELKAVALRSAIIKKILETKKKYCDASSTEYVLPVSDYMRSSYPVICQPIHTLPKVSVDEIVHVFCDQEMDYAKVVGENPQLTLVKIRDLMFFDPYMNFGELVEDFTLL